MRAVWTWLWGRSIRRQLVLGVALVHMLLMTIFVFDLVHRQRRFLRERAAARAIFQAELLASNSVHGVLSNDLAGLSELLDSLAKDPTVRFAAVTDPAGRVLSHTDRAKLGMFLTDPQSSIVLHGAARSEVIGEGRESTSAAAPVLIAGRTLGWAWIDRDLTAEQQHLQYVTRAGLLYTAVAIAVGTVFALLLSGTVLRQLRLVVAGTRRLANERFDPIPVTTDNEVGVLARAFNTAAESLAAQRAELLATAEALREANRAKDDFLGVLSHELRTPLTPVLLTVSVLERDDQLPAHLREDLQVIRENVEIEARLINDLLDLTRIVRRRLDLTWQDAVDVHAVIRAAIASVKRDDGPTVTVEFNATHATMRCDPVRLRQVFWNLVDNARKFTEPGGRITVRTSDVSSGRLRVEVSDNGIGIDPAVLPKLFTAFEQGEIRAVRQHAGLGLGLAIAKHLVEAQKGTITAASEGRGKGAMFVVEFPTVVADPSDAKSTSDQTNRLAATAMSGDRPLRILVVEDHQPTLEVLAKLLTWMGHHTTMVSSCAEATEAARLEQFDLLLSDLGLPDGNGLELMRRVGDRVAGRGIALTGHGSDADIRSSRAAGFAAHLTKPVNYQQLQETIRQAVEA